jgi:hypothetical protein
MILIHIDFVESHTFQVQNEVQFMYYHSTQRTILVQVTYTSFSTEAYKDNVATLVHETHYYIFDDRTHDTLFVQHDLLQHWWWLQSQGRNVKTHYVFSDGYFGQFKGAQAMYFAAR